jgi:phosphoribosylaminoimidazole (AIR) synthetase
MTKMAYHRVAPRNVSYEEEKETIFEMGMGFVVAVMDDVLACGGDPTVRPGARSMIAWMASDRVRSGFSLIRCCSWDAICAGLRGVV